MKKLLKLKHKYTQRGFTPNHGGAGFTLIELLVVITLIAILAVAVLATINPVEQRRKGIDVGAANAAGEFYAALERYFTTFNCYPWDADIGPGLGPEDVGDCSDPAPADGDDITDANIQLLLEAGEIKNLLWNRMATAPYDTSTFSEDANGEPHVCFLPTSRAYMGIASDDQFDANPNPAALIAVCDNAGLAATPCYICSPDTTF